MSNSIEFLRSSCEMTFSGMLNSISDLELRSTNLPTSEDFQQKIASLQHQITENSSLFNEQCIKIAHSTVPLLKQLTPGRSTRDIGRLMKALFGERS